MRLSLQFALIRALFKIFGAICKDTYKDICKYFGIRPMDEQISARQSKFNLRYCASESIDVQKRFYVFFILVTVFYVFNVFYFPNVFYLKKTLAKFRVASRLTRSTFKITATK